MATLLKPAVDEEKEEDLLPGYTAPLPTGSGTATTSTPKDDTANATTLGTADNPTLTVAPTLSPAGPNIDPISTGGDALLPSYPTLSPTGGITDPTGYTAPGGTLSTQPETSLLDQAKSGSADTVNYGTSGISPTGFQSYTPEPYQTTDATGLLPPYSTTAVEPSAATQAATAESTGVQPSYADVVGAMQKYGVGTQASDPASVFSWLKQLGGNGMTLDQFGQQVQSGLTPEQKVQQAMWDAGVGSQASDPASVQSWLRQIGEGKPLEQLVSEVRGGRSQEDLIRNMMMYGGAPDQADDPASVASWLRQMQGGTDINDLVRQLQLDPRRQVRWGMNEAGVGDQATDAASIDSWLRQINNGSSLDQLIASARSAVAARGASQPTPQTPAPPSPTPTVPASGVQPADTTPSIPVSGGTLAVPPETATAAAPGGGTVTNTEQPITETAANLGSSQADAVKAEMQRIGLGAQASDPASVQSWLSQMAATGKTASQFADLVQAQTSASTRPATSGSGTPPGTATGTGTAVTPSTGTSPYVPGWAYQGTGYVPPQGVNIPAYNPTSFSLPAYQAPGAVPGLPSMLDLLRGMPGYQGAGAVPTPQGTEALVNGLPAAQRGQGYMQTESEAGGLTPQLQQYLSQWMATPNRYTTPLMEGRIQQINDAIRSAQTDAVADTDAWAASRGLVGSSLEGEARNRLISNLDANRLSQYNDLLSQMASAEAADRSAAGSYGLGLGGFLQGQDAFRSGENRYAYGTGYQAGRDYEGDILNRATLGMNARSTDNAANMAWWDRNRQAAQDAESGLLSRTGMMLGAGQQDASNILSRYGLTQANARDYETAALNRAQMGQTALNADNQTRLSTYDRILQAARDAEAARQFDAQYGLSANQQQYGQYADSRDFTLSQQQLAAQIEAQRAANELARNQLSQGQYQFDTSRLDNLDANELQQLFELMQLLGGYSA